MLAIKLSTNRGPIILCTLYRPPRIPYLPFVDIANVMSYKLPTFFIGDFNCNHSAWNNGRCSNAVSRQLYSLTLLHRLQYLGPDFPTFMARGMTGKPDLVFSNSRAFFLNSSITAGAPTLSDHLPIILRISTSPILVPTEPRLWYSRADWEGFKDTLTRYTNTNMDNTPHVAIEEEWHRLTKFVNNAVKKHIPRTSYRKVAKFTASMRTKRLRIALENRFKDLLRTRPEHRDAITQDIHWLQRGLRESLFHDSNREEGQLMSSLSNSCETDPSKFWRDVKHLLVESPQPPPKVINHLTHTAYTPQHQADLLASAWSEVFKPHSVQGPHCFNTLYRVNSFMRSCRDLAPDEIINLSKLDEDDPLIAPIDKGEIEAVISALKTKAPGPSGIGTQILKRLPAHTITHMTTLYNCSLSSGYFPPIFKSSHTILILKPQKPASAPLSYRPISLLEYFGKVFEHVLCRRLTEYLEKNEILRDCQFGFRPERSAEDVIALLAQFAQKPLDGRPGKAVLVSKDVEKAFDTVWHEGLKYKLHHLYDFPLPFTRLLCNYLDDRKIRIKWRGCLSQPFVPKAGVPQGSVLAPTLYNLYTNDIPEPTYPRNQALTLSYADDTNHISRHQTLEGALHIMQNILDGAHSWEQQWRIKTNASKCNAVYFHCTKNNRTITETPLKINNTNIPVKAHTRVLGSTLDSNLNWYQHFLVQRTRAKAVLGRIKRFKATTLATKRRLYLALVRPILCQSPGSYEMTCHTNNYSHQKVQNVALRFITDAKWSDFRTAESLHHTADIKPLNQHKHKLHSKHLDRLHARHEQLIRHITPRPDVSDYLSAGPCPPPRYTVRRVRT